MTDVESADKPEFSANADPSGENPSGENPKIHRPNSAGYKSNQISWIEACFRSDRTKETIRCICLVSIISCIVVSIPLIWFALPTMATVLTTKYGADGAYTFTHEDSVDSKGEAIWWMFVVYNCLQVAACIVVPLVLFAIATAIFLIFFALYWFCRMILNCHKPFVSCYKTIDKERKEYNEKVNVPIPIVVQVATTATPGDEL